VRRFQIVEVLEVVNLDGSEPGRALQPFRVIEVFDTIDGPRTRVCEQSHGTRGDAAAWIAAKLYLAKTEDAEHGA
jgi:hypothetical protein